MAQYVVKAPCAYVNADGAAVQHTAAAVDSAVVELSDDTAAALGAAVQPLGAAPDTANPTPFPDAGRRGKRAADAASGEAAVGSDG